MTSVMGIRFWLAVGMFQIVFGLGVFTVTRNFYVADSESAAGEILSVAQPVPDWSDRVLELDPALLSVLPSAQRLADNPVELSIQANEFFANNQFALAAEAYERLLSFNPENGDVHNNLGLTLHYLGRSTDALRWLNEGTILDPVNQRLWLTLGFVNRELGNLEQARTALTTATNMDSTTSVGQSAAKMLAELP